MTAPAVYFSHPSCMEHDPRQFSPGHPDTPERLVVLERVLQEREWLGWERRAAPAAQEAQLELVHSAAHLQAVRELCLAGGGRIDADTFVGERSYAAALHAAGAACEMTRLLLDGEISAGFCGVRPSGHHAEAERAMGFCLFNNVAAAAAAAIAEHGLRRVFVLDWDVHHGNGTAEIFRQRADVLFASIHQSPLYPGTGALRDVGSGAGEGATINLPVPPGSDERQWLALLDRVVLPAAEAFRPELILISAGFDAHEADPLAHCRLRTASFVSMAERVRRLSQSVGAPLGAVQEGGYDSGVLAECVCAVLPALAGEASAGAAVGSGPGVEGAPERGVEAGSSPTETAEDPLVERAVEQYARYWPLR